MKAFMKTFFALSLVVAVAEAAAIRTGAAAFKADIRADSNRDGKVDVEGASDLGGGKETWTEQAGALFLPNIGDTEGRCRGLHSRYEDEKALVKCNDASDDIQRAPQYLAPLRTVPIPGLGPSAAGSISVSDRAARELVRIFRLAPPSDERGNVKADDWQIVTGETTFSADELAKGLQLGIDARGPRGHKTAEPDGDGARLWDGRATVHFTVTDGETTSTDSVMLRVAPLLTYSHLQRAVKVFAFPSSGVTEETFKELSRSVKKAGIDTPVQRTTGITDFIQDLFETMYASIPGPDGNAISLPVLLPAPMNNFGGLTEAAGHVARQIRFSGVGMVTDVLPPKGNVETLDAMGNLETIPPYEFNGKKFPAGRIIMGANETQSRVPMSVPFLRAQEMQDPLLVDSTWLEVQHVDEFLQFLPAKTPRGWRLMVSDPLAGLKLLQDAQADGYGNVTYTSRPPPKSGSRFATVDQRVADDAVREQQECARRIQAAVDAIKRETGITDDEILGVPALYSTSTDPVIRPNGEFQARASYPSAINGLVLTDSLYLAPKQWGLLDASGTDVIQRAVEKVYKEAGYDVDFVDDWDFHQRQGDIHCATNVLRETPAPWWRADTPAPSQQGGRQPEDPRGREQALCSRIGKSLSECRPQVAECVFRVSKEGRKYENKDAAWAAVEACVEKTL